MSRRITKKIAEEASYIISEEAYEDKISEAKKKLSDFVDNLVVFFYPHDVLLVVDKYKEFLYTTNTVYVEHPDNTDGTLRVPAQVSYRLPYNAIVKVPLGSYKRAAYLNRRLMNLYNKRETYREQTCEFLRGKYIESLASAFPDYYRVLRDYLPI